MNVGSDQEGGGDIIGGATDQALSYDKRDHNASIDVYISFHSYMGVYDSHAYIETPTCSPNTFPFAEMVTAGFFLARLPSFQKNAFIVFLDQRAVGRLVDPTSN